MKVGDWVRIWSDWSLFAGRRGTVVQVEPYPMVQIDDEDCILRFGRGELVVLDEPDIGGAE